MIEKLGVITMDLFSIIYFSMCIISVILNTYLSFECLKDKYKTSILEFVLINALSVVLIWATYINFASSHLETIIK